ncbi:tripartite tricarboxylate transporter TctB family protein [Propioniciclava coleopterorum]|uniref:Tripartite tricarboxylate transporter TctB family protein n=1 Tax=Propioniciclava coleopterorum TaxID=2714937 RepID=A0A6G7Y943_9ACTN|nr:tripartite tricarboxylate transporter TctB family protein [Propioniciclava coleopterorum]QIK73414.1 tripartite tricarboxylate transporter TctB family protein [Propioniciclava coleopterorum]
METTRNRRLNFLSSIVLIALSVAITVGSIYILTASRASFIASPGLMPLMLGLALLGMSLALFVQSLRDGGVPARVAESRAWFAEIAAAPGARTTVIGLAIMALYAFVLMPFLPFWAASLIFMIGMLAFLRAARWWVILILSVGVVGLVYLIFQILFRVPLP